MIVSQENAEIHFCLAQRGASPNSQIWLNISYLIMKKSQSVPFQEVPFSAQKEKKKKIRAVLITL